MYEVIYKQKTLEAQNMEAYLDSIDFFGHTSHNLPDVGLQVPILSDVELENFLKQRKIRDKDFFGYFLVKNERKYLLAKLKYGF